MFNFMEKGDEAAYICVKLWNTTDYRGYYQKKLHFYHFQNQANLKRCLPVTVSAYWFSNRQQC